MTIHTANAKQVDYDFRNNYIGTNILLLDI